MRGDVLLSIVVVVLGAMGTWLLLPHGHGAVKPRSVHIIGGVLVAAAIALLMAFWTPPGTFLTSLFFYAFALAALAGGVLMITSRSPVHSALWFASVVLSTSGLFLLAGAQFLAAGTIIVYAGAIIVTFLFVIMLAQAGGEAAYDRAARSPARATFSCFLLFWTVLYALIMVQKPDGPTLDEAAAARRLLPTARIPKDIETTRPAQVETVLAEAVRPVTARFPVVPPLPPGTPPPHVAGLGGTLFTDHLIAVEVAGAILFVALVGAAAIATPKPPVRPNRRTESTV
jgi:NADH-quinone oxidoreductase subunit J